MTGLKVMIIMIFSSFLLSSHFFLSIFGHSSYSQVNPVKKCQLSRNQTTTNNVMKPASEAPAHERAQ
jgi:hypothetical protein